jgi:hypothetical protein
MPPRRAPAAILALVLLATAVPALASDEWRFQVLLDGSPIGTQLFQRTRDGNLTRISIEATFDVKVLFFTAYTYRHRNEEVWDGSCLRSMDSTTDDNGTRFRVRATAEAGALVVDNGKGSTRLDGCIDSFAYWAPEELRASHLLNSQTGEYEAVSLRELGKEDIVVRGKPTRARRLALEGEKLRIDLWYSDTDDDWLALESTTTSGRKLYYQRQ